MPEKLEYFHLKKIIVNFKRLSMFKKVRVDTVLYVHGVFFFTYSKDLRINCL